MRVSVPLLTLVGTVAGTAAAVVAYQSAASVGADPAPASSTIDQPETSTTTSWLPCERGWKVKGDTCVRVKEKVVVVHDLPAPAAPQAWAATSGSASTSHSSSDDEAEHAAETEDDSAEVEDESGDVEHSDDGGSDHEDVGHDD